MDPLFSYMGGKRRLLPFYQPFLEHLPEHKLYVEPFFGSGAVFASIRETWHGPAIIGETSWELINLYKAVRDDEDFPERALREFERLEATPNTAEERKEHFKLVCAEHRESPDPAKLFFLQNFQFNALFGVNSRGQFSGLPSSLLWGKPFHVAETMNRVAFWQEALQNATISLGSYESHSFNPEGAFIFLDPPYRATKDYGAAFTDEAQLQLITWAKEQAAQGATVLLANKDSGDGFFQEAVGEEGSIFLQEFNHIPRGAKPVTELLAVFTPEGPWKHQALFKRTLFDEALSTS